MKRKIEIEHGKVLDTVANVCQVDVKRLCMKPCRGGFTVLLGRTRSLGRYNGKKRLFTLTQFGESLTDVSSDARQIFDQIDRLEAAIKAAPAITRTVPDARINAMTTTCQAETRVSVAAISNAKKKRVAIAPKAIIHRFMEDSAQKRHDDARTLEAMSEDARQKRFDKLLQKADSIQDVWELYKRMYESVGPALMARFAPDAMTPLDFELACSWETVHGQMKRVTCPCCQSNKFTHNDGLTSDIGGWGLRVSFWCDDCGLPLHVTISFE